jgi:hypothetical protein
MPFQSPIFRERRKTGYSLTNFWNDEEPPFL